jgi:hypothetical protein
MGATQGRLSSDAPMGALRRQLLGLMRSTTGPATPSMRRALDRSYRSCRRSVEDGLRLGSGNAWSRRWRPYVEKYGPASAGYQAAAAEGSELYTQFVRMFEECQSMKLKYGYQQYQFVRSAEYPHAVPVRFASPLRPDQLPLIGNHVDLDRDDDPYRKPTHWKRQQLWRQLLRRLQPVTPPTEAELQEDPEAGDPRLQVRGIDRVQLPLPYQDDPPTRPDAQLARGAASGRRSGRRRRRSRRSRPVRRMPLPDKIAAQQALRSPHASL